MDVRDPMDLAQRHGRRRRRCRRRRFAGPNRRPGLAHLWPADVAMLRLTDGTTVIGELVDVEYADPTSFEQTGDSGTEPIEHWLVKTGNRRVDGPDWEPGTSLPGLSRAMLPCSSAPNGAMHTVTSGLSTRRTPWS